MNKRKTGMIFFLIIICVFVFVGGYFYGRNTAVTDIKKGKVLLSYGDDINKMDINKFDKTKATLLPSDTKYLLVIYLDSKCGSCYKQLETFERYEELLKKQIEVALLWGNGIPNQNYEKYGIKESNVFYLDGNKTLSESPSAYIINSKGNIVFTTSDMKKIMEKIIKMEDINVQESVLNSNNYLKDMIQEDNSKTDMIYFAMEGCKDCEAANQIIDEDITTIYNIEKIYTENDYGSEQFVDLNDIFATLYDISWYPSFLIIEDNQNYRIVGETPIDKLKEALLNPKE